MSSLQERLAHRREQLQRERSFVLPVLGYEDVGLFVRYRVLAYEELRTIARRNQDVAETTEGELAAAADTLSTACEELLERRDDGSFRNLGHRWTTAAARELFGVELPEGSGTRDALRQIFSSMQLMLHFNAYDEEATSATLKVDEGISGNSEARSATEEQSISQ